MYAAAAPQKEICNYYANTPIYSLDWSRGDPERPFRAAMGSLIEEPINKVNLQNSHKQKNALAYRIY